MRILAFLLVLASNQLLAQLRLAKLFSSQAVLQRQQVIPVWGWAKPGSSITVTLASQNQQTTATNTGKWIVQLPALDAGGPHILKVTDGTKNIELTDILIGDVWLCSGQSNMEWRLRQADNFAKEKKDANYPAIRHFYVDHRVSINPDDDLAAGNWQQATEQTVGEFTAIGFLFAREIYQKTKVPIGILHSSWGGSQLEGWLSRETMQNSLELSTNAKNLPNSWQEADAQQDAKLRSQLFGTAQTNPSSSAEQRYLLDAADISKWHHLGNPIGQLDWRGIWAFRGNGFMATQVDIPASVANKTSTLALAIQNSRNQIYINGNLIADTTIAGTRRLTLKPNTWRAGQNLLMIKQGGMVEPAYYGLGLMGNPAELFVSTDTERISLADGWKVMPSFADKHEYTHGPNNVATTLYNGMIAPLLPYAIKGALWYQGETNAGRAYQYRHSFPLMINDWRQRWASQFPFYWVQLTSYGAANNSNTGSNWAELREAQTMTLSLPKTGQAVIYDVGNPADIHPTNKQTVAQRLAALALTNDYAIPTPALGPVYKSVSFKKGKAILSFDHTGNGLTIKDKYGYLKGFEICGKDKKWTYAKANIVKNQVVLEMPNKAKPMAVRYAWSDSPIEANLFNSNDLPAVPFRTDTWAGITYGNKFQ
jgi:sialate O-acetylesterase